MNKTKVTLVDVSNLNLNLNARLDGDGGDLLHDVGGGEEIDEALVDAHLEPREGLIREEREGGRRGGGTMMS